MSHEIKSIRARWVLDSRGNPTVEATVSTARHSASAIVPSGASTGLHEAKELRDGGKAFAGNGVEKAVANVNKKISKKLHGFDVTEQRAIDEAMMELDGTKNKSKLGANAILAVSLACAGTAAKELGVPLYQRIGVLAKNRNFSLPVPCMNIINGGVHAGNDLDVQEFMLAPIRAKSFSEAVRICSEIYHLLKMLLKDKHGAQAVNVGDEGGFAPPISSATNALDFMENAVSELGYSRKVKFALDVAASELYDEQRNSYMFEGKPRSAEWMLDFYDDISSDYPIFSIEDPFSQDDWDSFVTLTHGLGTKFQVVGDDLLVTSPERIGRAIAVKAANALLLKVNQVGTLTESIDASRLAMKNSWNVMVSHRSGETEDTFIADLAVGLGCGQIKAGAPCRGERTAKYNRLLHIESEMKRPAYGIKGL